MQSLEIELHSNQLSPIHFLPPVLCSLMNTKVTTNIRVLILSTNTLGKWGFCNIKCSIIYWIDFAIHNMSLNKDLFGLCINDLVLCKLNFYLLSNPQYVLRIYLKIAKQEKKRKLEMHYKLKISSWTQLRGAKTVRRNIHRTSPTKCWFKSKKFNSLKSTNFKF